MNDEIKAKIAELSSSSPRCFDQLRAKRLTDLAKEYSDISIDTYKGHDRYYTSAVNEEVDLCEIICDCSYGSLVEVFPYLITQFGRVYSDPPRFVVGEWLDFDYARPFSDWYDRMDMHSIGQSIIDQVFEYFDSFEDDAMKE